jgi:pimeloyl-ACP methyl ester carboxylesterase
MIERVDLAVDVRGSGRTLVLLHGLGASRDHFDEVADALDGRFRIVLPDLRGHGDSPAARVKAIGDYVGDLIPIVHANPPAAIAGLSFGGDLALELWNAAPEAVDGVCLVDPLLDFGAILAWARGRARTRRGQYRQAISPYLEHDFERLVGLMAEYPLTADLDYSGRARNARSHLRASDRTIHDTLRVLRAPRTRPARPPGNEARALVLRAERSMACPPAAAAELAARLGGDVASVDAGHCASLSAPDRLADALARWLGS